MPIYSGLQAILELEVLEVGQILGAGNGGQIGSDDLLVEDAEPLDALEPRMVLHIDGALVRVS